jgi:hypothetical protein
MRLALISFDAGLRSVKEDSSGGVLSEVLSEMLKSEEIQKKVPRDEHILL